MQLSPESFNKKTKKTKKKSQEINHFIWTKITRAEITEGSHDHYVKYALIRKTVNTLITTKQIAQLISHKLKQVMIHLSARITPSKLHISTLPAIVLSTMENKLYLTDSGKVV